MYNSVLVVDILGQESWFEIFANGSPNYARHMGINHPLYRKISKCDMPLIDVPSELDEPFLAHVEYVIGGQLQVWVLPQTECETFRNGLYKWYSGDSDILGAYWKLKAMALKKQMEMDKLVIKADEETLAEKIDQAYEVGKRDGILMQNRELRSSVINVKHWKNIKPKNDLYTWQDLFCQQVAVTERLHKENSDLLNLIITLTGEYLPPRPNFVEMVEKSARQMARIAELENKVTEMMNVDYGVVVQLAISTEIDTAWNRANFAQRIHIEDVLKGLSNDV